MFVFIWLLLLLLFLKTLLPVYIIFDSLVYNLIVYIVYSLSFIVKMLTANGFYFKANKDMCNEL